MQGAQVRSLVRELDPTGMLQVRIRMPIGRVGGREMQEGRDMGTYVYV